MNACVQPVKFYKVVYTPEKIKPWLDSNKYTALVLQYNDANLDDSKTPLNAISYIEDITGKYVNSLNPDTLNQIHVDSIYTFKGAASFGNIAIQIKAILRYLNGLHIDPNTNAFHGFLLKPIIKAKHIAFKLFAINNASSSKMFPHDIGLECDPCPPSCNESK